MSYRGYLKSDKWESIKKKQKQLQNKCTVCKSKKRLHVHHKSYKNFGEETPKKDLATLCKKCHMCLHRLNNTGRTILQKSDYNYTDKQWIKLYKLLKGV